MKQHKQVILTKTEKLVKVEIGSVSTPKRWNLTKNSISQNKDYVLQNFIRKSSRPTLCDSMFSHEFDIEEAHVWGNGHRWEMPRIGLGASKWKGPKNFLGKINREFLFVAPFLLSGKVYHGRCREKEKAPKGEKMWKGWSSSNAFGFALHEIRSFQLSRFLLKHIPSLNQWVVIQKACRISSQFVAPAPQCLGQHYQNQQDVCH